MTTGFGVRMRSLMAERDVSLRALARQVHFDVGYLSRVMNGRQPPSEALAAALDEALQAQGELAQAATRGTETRAPYGRRVGPGMVEYLRRRTARLRHLDEYLGGADTYPLYVTEMDATAALVDEASYTESTGRQLLGVLAEQAQQAGWAAFDAGWHPAARRLWKTSLTAATDAGETSLIANALTHLAYQKVSIGHPGVEESDAACRVAGGNTPPTVRALLYERAAWAYAQAGPGHERDVQRALGDAETALDADGEPGPDWALWVDDVELKIMTGRCFSVLHKPSRAIGPLGDGLARYEDTRARDKALYSTWLAEAHIEAGDIEQAAAVLGEAFELAAGLGSVRPYQRSRGVLARFEPHRSVRAVVELMDRVATSSYEPAIPDTPPTRHRSR